METKTFVIKTGLFFFVGYEEESDEYIYSTSAYSAMKFETLEELDKTVEELKITGYAVGTV